MKPHLIALVIGLLALSGGAILGFTSTSVSLDGRDINCGSGFRAEPSPALLFDDEPRTVNYEDDGSKPEIPSAVSDCNDVLGARRSVAFALIGIGGLVTVGTALPYLRRKS